MNQQPDPNNPPTSSPENQPRYVFIAGPIADSDEIQSIEDGIPGGIHHFIGRETAASETPIWAIVEFMTYVQAKHAVETIEIRRQNGLYNVGHASLFP